MITIIVAIAENGAIGYRNRLLYHISADLKRFKELTSGHTIIMGRKTFQSLPKGALPNRRNIVLSRSEGAHFEGAECYTSLASALNALSSTDNIFIIGGAEIYKQAIDIADRLEVTLVHATPPQADAFFPQIGREWSMISSQYNEADTSPAFSFQTYTRTPKG